MKKNCDIIFMEKVKKVALHDTKSRVLDWI